jgi:hypothetical protein
MLEDEVAAKHAIGRKFFRPWDQGPIAALPLNC